MKRFYLIALAAALLAGCGDSVVNVPEEEKAFLEVRLGCSNGITVYSIEGDTYVEGAAREKSVDAMGGKGYTFTVVANTEYVVRANNSVRDGHLLGSVRVKSGAARERVKVEVPCN